MIYQRVKDDNKMCEENFKKPVPFAVSRPPSEEGRLFTLFSYWAELQILAFH